MRMFLCTGANANVTLSLVASTLCACATTTEKKTLLPSRIADMSADFRSPSAASVLTGGAAGFDGAGGGATAATGFAGGSNLRTEPDEPPEPDATTGTEPREPPAPNAPPELR